MKNKITPKIVILISVALFILSLPMESYCANGCANSLLTLCIGILGIFTISPECISGICWLANPLLLTSWIIGRQNTLIAMIMSAGATVLSLAFYFIGKVYADEGGHYKTVEAYKAGYWLWVASAVAMLIGSIFIFIRNRKKQPIQ